MCSTAAITLTQNVSQKGYYTAKKEAGSEVKQVKVKGGRKVGFTWQTLDVGGQQLGFLLLIALLRDVT